MNLTILSSSSSGNCALIESKHTRLLLDIGISFRKVNKALQNLNYRFHELDGILLTHEHSDHCRGLTGMPVQRDIPIYANFATGQSIRDKLEKTFVWNYFETGNPFQIKDLTITPLRIPHDASDPVGFIIQEENAQGQIQSIGWMSDLGFIPQGVGTRMQDVDLLVLESNYENELLDQDTKRPWSVKQRIRGRHGHLSNEDALDYVTRAEGKWKEVRLVHLSKDCNQISKVIERFERWEGLQQNIQLKISNPEACLSLGEKVDISLEAPLFL